MAPFDANQLQPPWITNQQEAPWVPLETKKDCSQGICSIYCPQLCYTVFPPPPPSFSFDEDNDNSSGGPSVSPLVIAIVGILASAILLVSYYTVISKYCGFFRRPRLHLDPPGLNNDHRVDVEEQEEEEEDDENQYHHHDVWHVSRSNGLDEALINKITVCKYRRGDGLVEGTDCSVCLSEFREEESLRLLPKCSHAFHLQCIDTWLRSHLNCPLCRANIVVLVNPLPPPQLPFAPPRPLQWETSHPEAEGEHNTETVVVIEDSDEVNYGHEDIASKETSDGQEENQSIVEIMDSDDADSNDGVDSDSRSFSMDSSHIGIVSIADILQRKMEDESKVVEDNGFRVGSGSCSKGRGEKSRSRNVDSVNSPVLMKRSASSTRFV